MIYRLLIAVTCMGLSIDYPTAQASKETPDVDRIVLEFEPGELEMDKFLDACPAIANLTSSNRVLRGIVGEVMIYNDQAYEIIMYGFEDTTGKLTTDMTFQEYVKQNNLRYIRSHIIRPFSSITFDCFDFRHADLNDGVYFTIVVRKLDQLDTLSRPNAESYYGFQENR